MCQQQAYHKEWKRKQVQSDINNDAIHELATTIKDVLKLVKNGQWLTSLNLCRNEQEILRGMGE